MKKVITLLLAAIILLASSVHAQSNLQIDSITGGVMKINYYYQKTGTDTVMYYPTWGLFLNQVLQTGPGIQASVAGTYTDTLSANATTYFCNVIYKNLTTGDSGIVLANTIVTVMPVPSEPTLGMITQAYQSAIGKMVINIPYTTNNLASLKREISYGDSTLSFPVTSTFPLTIGSGTYKDTLPQLPAGYLLSFRYTITNTVDDTVSATIASWIPPGAQAPTVNQPIVTSVTTDSVRFTVDVSLTEQTTFIFELWKNGSVIKSDTSIMQAAPPYSATLSHVFGSLLDSTTYELRVCATNSVASVCSGIVSFTTLSIAPTLNFSNLTITQMQGSTATLQFDGIFPVAANQSVNVIWTDSTDVSYSGAMGTAVSTGGTAGIFQLQASLTSLVPNNWYRASVYGNDGTTQIAPGDIEIVFQFLPTSTGVEEHSFETNFGIAPNPFNSFTTFSFPKIGGELTVTDIAGRIVTSLQIATESLVFERKDLKPGVYMVTYNKGTNVSKRKMIVF